MMTPAKMPASPTRLYPIPKGYAVRTSQGELSIGNLMASLLNTERTTRGK